MNIKQAAALAAKLAGRAGFINLQPSEGGLTLTAHDFGNTLELDVEGAINDHVLVPAAQFAKMIGYMPEAVLSVKHRILSLETEYALIGITGADPERQLKTAEHVQDPADTDEIPFDRDDFAWCSHNTSPDDGLPVLSGVAIDRTTGALAASDGFRLRYTGTDADPARMAVLQARLLPYMPAVEKIRANKTYSLLEGPGVRFWAQLIQGTFLDFRKLTPEATELKWRVDIDTLFLRPAVNGPLSLIARDGSGIMRIEKSKEAGKILLSTRAEEVGEAHFNLPADIVGDDPKIAINIGYFREVLAGAAHAERLTIQGIDPSHQLVFSTDNENRHEVVMPMFVQW